MLGLLRLVAWTMTAIAMLLLFTTECAHAQGTKNQGTEPQDADARAADAERVIADRYEKILTSRPQLGSAFDKFYEIHARQGTLDALCKRIETAAQRGEAGNLYQLLGLLQLQRGLGNEAIHSLTKAELLLPEEPLASLYLSRALSLNRQYVPAFDAINNAATRKPTQAIAIEIVKELRLLKDRGLDVDAAGKLLSEFEGQFKTSPQVYELLANTYIELGLSQAAVPVYENLVALTRDPLRRIEVRMQLARLKKRLGKPQQALEDLEELATQVKPQSWLHNSLIEQIEQFTEELHGIEGVIAYYERTLVTRPDDITSMLRLAKTLASRSRTDDSQKWISKAIEASPTQPEPLLAMVDLCEKTEQLKRASEVMQQLVQLDPSNVDYIVRWGRIEARSSATGNSADDQVVNHANAAAIWKRILVGHENDRAKAIQVAELLRSISFTEEALKLYRQAVQASGESTEYCELLAEYLIELDRRDEALRVLTSSVVAAAKDRESLFELSRVLARFKFQKEAIETLEKACEERPAFGDLILLAEMQLESNRFDAAIDTLNRATQAAENAADWTRVWDTQVKTYRRVNNLAERLAQSKKSLESSEPKSFEALQQLALLQSANNQPAEAAETAFSATALSPTLERPEAMQAWLLTAKLQHEAGLSIGEIQSLQELSRLDAPHATDYLQSIATVHFQLNQVEQALETMNKILALPNATLQHFQLAASFCLQAKRPEQAVDILNQATQAFPRDRSSWLLLARQLTELKKQPASLDAAWHVLDLSRDQAQQREAISLLVTIYQSDMAGLLAGLQQFGVAYDKESLTDLWSAWAMLDSDSKQPASQLIANLAKRSDATAEALQAAVALAVRVGDFAQAGEIQRQIILKEARPDQLAMDRLKLGELLWRSGDKEAAAIEWQNVMRVKSNAALLSTFAQNLNDNGNWSITAALVNLGLELDVQAWDFISLGIFANLQDKNLSKAAELSDKLLALDLPADTMMKQTGPSAAEFEELVTVPLTANDRLTWLEHAGAWQATLNEVNTTKSGYRTNLGNPRASQAATVRYLAIQRGASVRSNPMTRLNVKCFAEARALAVLARFGKVNQQRLGANSDFLMYVAKAIESKNVQQLWDCVLIMEPASHRDVSSTTTGVIENRGGNSAQRYVDVLDTLVALNEPTAVELAINEIVSRRQLQQQLADRVFQPVPAMDSQESARLQSLVHKVEGGNLTTAFNGKVTLAIEFLRSQRDAEGQQLLSQILTETKDLSALATSARQFLANDRATQQVVSQLLLRAFQLELESNGESTDLAFAISAYRNSERAIGVSSQGLILDMIQLQAKHVAGLSLELVFSDSRSNESRRAYRSFRKPAVVMPDRSSLLSTSLRAALLDSSTDELSKFIEVVTVGEAYDLFEFTVRHFAAGVAEAIRNEPEQALTKLSQAKQRAMAMDVYSLYEVWLLVANQRLEEANAVLATIKPSNESIQRECELWRMDLGMKLGNKAEAQRAARALSKLPLSVHENADVAAVLAN
ncbi:MAG: tetratricopeptide repeat protein [Pirellulaceae bacterium]|nr:tetratricopeptide repeat protein [Pirellulaceae bacterium]